jgi:hypothetical protein
MRNFVRNKNGGNKQQNHALLFSFLKVKIIIKTGVE